VGDQATINERPFLSPDYVEAKVNGRSLRFYSISIRGAFKIRVLGKSLAATIATLFGGIGREATLTRRDFKNDLTGEVGSEVVAAAIDPKLAEIKLKARQQAIETLIDSLLDEKNADVIGGLLMDSLRDEFTRPIQPDDVKAFIAGLDTKTLMEMLAGLSEANKDQFGPLASRLFAIQGETLADVKGPTPEESELGATSGSAPSSPTTP